MLAFKLLETFIANNACTVFRCISSDDFITDLFWEFWMNHLRVWRNAAKKLSCKNFTLNINWNTCTRNICDSELGHLGEYKILININQLL